MSKRGGINLEEVRINTVSENISEEDNLESYSSASIKCANDDERRITTRETSDFGLDLAKPTYVITEIINEDGTSLDDFPENPLKEKWLEKYPPTRYGSKCAPFETLPDGTVVANYGCILCHEKCMHSSSWEVPEEDKEEWDKYQEKIKEYHRIHNPNLITNINKTFENIKDTGLFRGLNYE